MSDEIKSTGKLPDNTQDLPTSKSMFDNLNKLGNKLDIEFGAASTMFKGSGGASSALKTIASAWK